MGVKVAVVGGGSTYTPELVEGLAARRDRLPVDELVLHDIDAERLEVVGGFAARMMRRDGWEAALRLTRDRGDALDGAAFVLVQLRVGGQAARRTDETLPLRFGCIGQETVGAGGFAKALRTVPVVLDIAEETARRAAPGAWLIDFTNPAGLVTQALLDHGHRAIGLCNSAIGFQRQFASLLEVDPERVQPLHVGLNHLTWEREVRVDGEDRLPDLLQHQADRLEAMTGTPLPLIQALEAVPSYYLRYYYVTDEVLAEQRQKRPRADEVAEIEVQLLELYRDPELDRKPDLLSRRGGAYYSEVAAGVIASLHGDSGDVHVVNVRNDGAVANVDPDAVVEVPARVDRDGAHPLPVGKLPPEMLGIVEQVKAFERLTIQAAVAGDGKAALKALVANPLVADYAIAAPLLEALLEANRRHLPRFFST
jgi:6-phospho-beta-glucosidase